MRRVTEPRVVAPSGVAATPVGAGLVTSSAAGASVLLAVGAGAGLWALVLAVALVQAAMVVGWISLSDLTGVWPGAALAGGAGICADILLAVRREDPLLLPVIGVVAAGFVIAVLGQLARRPPRAGLVPLLTTTVAALVVSGAGALWVATERTSSGHDLVVLLAVAGAGAALGAALAGGVPVSEAVGPLLAAAAGTLGGVAAALLASGPLDVSTWSATRSGAVIGALVALGTVVARYSAAPRPVPPLLAASVPVLLAGPAAYVVARLLQG